VERVFFLLIAAPLLAILDLTSRELVT